MNTYFVPSNAGIAEFASVSPTYPPVVHANPHDQVNIIINLDIFFTEVDFLLNLLSPTFESNTRRRFVLFISSYLMKTCSHRDVAQFIAKIICENISGDPICIFGCGSSCQRTYLPESDLDIVIITPSMSQSLDGLPANSPPNSVRSNVTPHHNHNTEILMSAFGSICNEVVKEDDAYEASSMNDEISVVSGVSNRSNNRQNYSNFPPYMSSSPGSDLRTSPKALETFNLSNFRSRMSKHFLSRLSSSFIFHRIISTLLICKLCQERWKPRYS